jgi:hypothetical protein
MVEIKPPDYDELMGMIEEIHRLMVEKQVLKVEIETAEAETVKKVSSERGLSPDGKLPSVTFINSTYKITGISNEITPKRKKYAVVSADLDRAEKMFDVMKMQFDHWRTEQANLRRSNI